MTYSGDIIGTFKNLNTTKNIFDNNLKYAEFHPVALHLLIKAIEWAGFKP